MTKFESDVKNIAAPQGAVYAMLSNPANLEKVRSMIPEEKVKNLSYDEDSITMGVDPIGALTLRIVECEPEKCIKFEVEGSPVPVNFWIQILPTSDVESKIRLTLGLEVNPFMKAMIQGKVQEAINKVADMLSMIHY